MKKFAVAFFVCGVFAVFSQSKDLPTGYGGVTLGMSIEETKEVLKKNLDFGYHGDRDVSLLPNENRALIETDTEKGHVISYLERCWFQFYKDSLYIITINVNREKMDHYSIFEALCKKYGSPDTVSPEKSVWKNDAVTMSLERPLTLKYVDQATFDKLQNASLVEISGTEASREMFLEGL